MSNPPDGTDRTGDRWAALAAPASLLNSATFWPFWFGVNVAMKLCFSARITNRPQLSGGYVLAANHASYLDPLLLGASSRRRVTFLMTEVVWRSPAMGWFYRWNRAIPLAARGGNRDALRTARSVLQQGRVVGIFPEGGLSRDGGLMLGSPGAVSLVLNESVPIVPVGIVGAADALPVGTALPRPRHIEVRFGEPILPAELTALSGDRKQRLQAATTLIMARIAALVGGVPREEQLAAAANGRA